MTTKYAPKVFVPDGMEAEQNAVDQLAMCLTDERAVAGALRACVPSRGGAMSDDLSAEERGAPDGAIDLAAIKSRAYVGDVSVGEIEVLVEVAEAAQAYLSAEKQLEHGFPDASGSLWEQADAASARLVEALSKVSFDG